MKVPSARAAPSRGVGRYRHELDKEKAAKEKRHTLRRLRRREVGYVRGVAKKLISFNLARGSAGANGAPSEREGRGKDL